MGEYIEILNYINDFIDEQKEIEKKGGCKNRVFLKICLEYLKDHKKLKITKEQDFVEELILKIEGQMK